jgi:hypothetical protein
MLEKLRVKLQMALWSIRKNLDERRKPTKEQGDLLVSAYNKAMAVFRGLQIDMESKSPEQRRLYNMVLLYMDQEEYICPAAMRTASLIGFLETTGSGWALPPTSVPVSNEFAGQVDGYMAMEFFRNYSGIEDIHNELKAAWAGAHQAIAATKAKS